MAHTQATRCLAIDGPTEEIFASRVPKPSVGVFNKYRRPHLRQWPQEGSLMPDSLTPADLVHRISQMPPDEQAIVRTLVDRLDAGRQSYGPWRLDDGRQYQAEALEEVLDALHYAAAQLVRMTRQTQTKTQEVSQ